MPVPTEIANPVIQMRTAVPGFEQSRRRKRRRTLNRPVAAAMINVSQCMMVPSRVQREDRFFDCWLSAPSLDAPSGWSASSAGGPQIEHAARASDGAARSAGDVSAAEGPRRE